MDDSVFIKTQEIFRSIFKNDQIVLTPETSTDDIDEWDSLSHMMLLMAIEQDFGITFSVGELQDLSNVGALIEVIQTKT